MAQPDTSIALSGRPVNVMLPHEALQAGLRTRQMQTQNAMMDMQMQDAQQAKETKSRLNALYQQSGGDIDSMLKSGGLDMDTAMSLMSMKGEQAKLQGQAAKENAQADKYRLQAGIEKLNYGSQLLAGATPENWQQIRQEFGQLTGQDLGDQFDQAKVQGLMNQGLSMKDRLANEWKAKGYELDVARFGEQSRHNRATEGLSAQRLADGGSSDSGGKPKNQVIYDNGLAYVIDVNNPTAPPIPVQAGGKQIQKPAKGEKFTEAQTNAALFGARAQEADALLKTVGDYSPVAVSAKQAAGNVPLIGGALEMAANTQLTENEQQVEQAQRNFINAILRKESGAAIGQNEFRNAALQYFPQPGDSKEVLLQKAQNRSTAIQGLKNAAGNAAFTPDTVVDAPPAKRMNLQQLQAAAQAKFGGDINAARKAAEQYGYTVE